MMHLRSLFPSARSLPALTKRYFAAPFLDRKEVVDRVLDTVKKFPKIDATKVTATSNFSSDLGLDSLDQVEIVMSIEDEFKVEIPDKEAETILTCEDAIKYIAAHPQAK